ncbi:right-handed parallel beta-helix repeat-containing protein [Mesorhizobium neociceri]|uniref:Right-handed parallel beta-helix repeat-containing protein n=1 Tax=Mesorhizobium neociceri TaxID=1307853 RepID=A0A838BB60_9HYPH|nr:right-handed parallel beta-helix repeat-containing protein [Mesorhizobium neociceri]MBA1143317.1 right-handed parallel beta-helix repeat-containing protein [Mesorhizobium neociceri]
MKGISYVIYSILVALLVTCVTSPASAQAPRTWVSGVGDDVNPCSRTAPCKTFAGAISKTAAGGEINCIDPGGFGAVTITKSITIACEDVEAGISNAGTQVTINALATDVVVLRGLDIDTATASPGINGIRFLAGAALHIEDCVIRGSSAAAPNGNGVFFAPSGTSELYITNSFITDNGTDGVHIQPTGAGVAKVIIDNSTIENNNLAGVKADGTSNTGGSNTTIVDSSVSGNTNAGISILNPVGGPAINIMVDGVAVANNGAAGGLRVDGANATIRVGRSTISGNTTGTAIVNGGVISSYGTNQLNGNTADGPNPPTIAQK